MASRAQYPMETSGFTDPVWVHKAPWSEKPRFQKLDKDLTTDVCIIGAGISGIQAAYELVKRGQQVVVIEAREVVSGETGRTSGHLCNAVDDSYMDIKKKHGQATAQAVADSHTWALKQIGIIAKELKIDCEYRLLPDYEISQHEKGNQEHDKEMSELKAEVEAAKDLGLEASYREGYAIKGWDGAVDQRDVAMFSNNATFHPTKYLYGLVNWLKDQPNFQCYTHTRMVDVSEPGMISFSSKAQVQTLAGNTITCTAAIQSTNIPLQKLSIVAQLEYFRTYCIAVRVPKGSYEDCLINDQADPYHYIRFTECDEKDDYLVIGGQDHKVGQEDESYSFFDKLEAWVRARYTKSGSVDYKWSGQIQNSVDMIQFVGKNQGQKQIYVVSGDTGHGLTMGVFAGRILAEEITGEWTDEGQAWSKAYSPNRFPPPSVIPAMVMHDLQINSQYKRFLQTDILDIEDLAPGTGGIKNTVGSKPVAVYKDDNGKTYQFSALCPHLQGVVCWNNVERSFDCPVHGSRFSKEGVCIIGPSKAGLSPVDEPAQQIQSDVL